MAAQMINVKRIAGSMAFLFLAACSSTVATDMTPTLLLEPDRTYTTSEVVEATSTADSTVTPTSTASTPTLYYECEGEGSPTIIIESGLGVSGTDPGTDGNWHPVMEGIRETTRICTYDRINLGRSARIPIARTSQDIVDDLHAMLTREGIEGPYILLGHSIGGFHVRLFAEQYPDQVVGMLLLDSTHPDHFAMYGEVFPTPSADEPTSWEQLRYIWTDPDVFAAKPDFEYFDFAASADLVRETGPYGDLPLIVLAMDPAKYTMHPEIAAALAIADDKAQRDLATLSTYTQGNYSIVPDAGHFIYVNQPQAVIDALLELIGVAQGKLN